jgi:type IV fimbrial biogenesis protein FimT
MHDLHARDSSPNCGLIYCSIYYFIRSVKSKKDCQLTQVIKSKISRRPSQGFTLIEAMMVVAISAILLAITIPGMRSMIENAAVNNAINAFSSAVTLTRVEAIKRGISVGMCPSTNADTADPPSCLSNSSDWSGGWLIFTDRSNSNSYDNANSILIQTQGRLFGSGPITRNSEAFLSFRPNGLMRAGSSQIDFDSASSSSEQKRRLCIGPSGRPQLITDISRTCT